MGANDGVEDALREISTSIGKLQGTMDGVLREQLRVVNTVDSFGTRLTVVENITSEGKGYAKGIIAAIGALGGVVGSIIAPLLKHLFPVIGQ